MPAWFVKRSYLYESTNSPNVLSWERILFSVFCPDSCSLLLLLQDFPFVNKTILLTCAWRLATSYNDLHRNQIHFFTLSSFLCSQSMQQGKSIDYFFTENLCKNFGKLRISSNVVSEVSWSKTENYISQVCNESCSMLNINQFSSNCGFFV